MNRILSLVRRCVEDYEMIAPNDRIAVGVSGGKDSLMLLMALAKLREFYPIPFQVEAFTLDHGTRRWTAGDGLCAGGPAVPGPGCPLYSAGE